MERKRILLEPRMQLTHPLHADEKCLLVVSEGAILHELQKDKLSPATLDEAQLS